MKYFIIIAVLFGVVFTNPILKENQSKNTFEVCVEEVFGVHVSSSHHARVPLEGEVQEEIVRYEIPGKPSGVYISCVTVTDLKEFEIGFQSTGRIISGGLYQSSVELLIKSERSNGYEYKVDIELNKRP